VSVLVYNILESQNKKSNKRSIAGTIKGGKAKEKPKVAHPTRSKKKRASLSLSW